jgi:hypothetical protein
VENNHVSSSNAKRELDPALFAEKIADRIKETLTIKVKVKDVSKI